MCWRVLISQVMLGAWVTTCDDERKVEQEETMKSQTYQRRLAFSGAFAGPQKESGHAATTKVEVQLMGSHAKVKPCK